MSYIIFGGLSCDDYGILAFPKDTEGAPERDTTEIEVPGRNGTVTVDNGRWKNMPVSYTLVAYGSDPAYSGALSEDVGEFKALLKQKVGYQRLEFSEDEDHYRLAKYTEQFSPTAKGDISKAVVTFDCYPQKWLTSGDTVMDFTTDGAITNPTHFTSKPVIRVTGAGSFTINGVGVTLASNPGYIDVDCEAQNCTYGSANKNDVVTLTTGSFPELVSGTNKITVGSGITKLSITPKWYTI